MASIKDLKKRIGTVKNTQQTTRAMKMVSAAKLRRSQDAILNQRPYAKRINEMIRQVAALSSGQIDSPLIAGADPAQGGSLLLLLVTSDRGLCAGFNANVIKAAQKFLQANAKHYTSIQLAFVGRRGHDFFKSRKVNLGPYYPELGGKVSFAKGKKLAESLVGLFLDGKATRIKVIYNEFKNAVTQSVVIEDFLPISPLKPSEKDGAKKIDEIPLGIYIVKPSLPELLESLLKKNFAAQAFRILLESQAGEHGARMSAMENATKNAGEMIKKLSLQYNKQRQAGITKELLEIISGSESQKSS